ncbi:MAG: hypothetical protein Tsb009_20520 [Planctomycetaceae bacterium]
MQTMVSRVMTGLVVVVFSWNSLAAQNPKSSSIGTIPVTGKENANLKPFDRLMLSFLKKHNIPGASLAVVKNGRLVYARGFGYADKKKREAVQPTSLFRIASISKPITAVAIFRLVEQGKLSLDDRVFDILKIKPFLPDGGKFDERHKKITIRHCLQHTGGWDRYASFDPMFRPVIIANSLKVKPPAKPNHIIRYMLGRKLDFDPGQKYAYSNYGYCLLGRVIEKKSGLTYENFVKREVLNPVKIRRMKIGRTLFSGRAAGEVRYYHNGRNDAKSVFAENLGKPVPSQYGGWYLEAMDSHGAWIASAVDLARFAAALDRLKQSKIMTPASYREMFAAPPEPVWRTKRGQLKAAFYACGWMVRPAGNRGGFNCWHTGSLPGTSTILVRRHDGLSWAVLFNTRKSKTGQPPAREIDSLVHRAANAVKKWPRADLFPEYP